MVMERCDGISVYPSGGDPAHSARRCGWPDRPDPDPPTRRTAATQCERRRADDLLQLLHGGSPFWRCMGQAMLDFRLPRVRRGLVQGVGTTR